MQTPDRAPAGRLGVHDHETGWRHRDSLVVSPAVACLSGLKSAPRKRVRGNPPRVQIPPPPPTDKVKRWPPPQGGSRRSRSWSHASHLDESRSPELSDDRQQIVVGQVQPFGERVRWKRGRIGAGECDHCLECVVDTSCYVHRPPRSRRLSPASPMSGAEVPVGEGWKDHHVRSPFSRRVG